MSDLKKWDNDINKFDVTEASRQINPWLNNYGRDRYTYSPELTFTSAYHLQRTEASKAHGYPATAWF